MMIFIIVFLFYVTVPPIDQRIKISNTNNPNGYDVGNQIVVVQGESNSISCLVQATLPSCDITWDIGEGQTSSPQTSSSSHLFNPDLFDTTSTYTFVPTRDDHLMNVSCSAVIDIAGEGRFPSPPAMKHVQLVVNGKC